MGAVAALVSGALKLAAEHQRQLSKHQSRAVTVWTPTQLGWGSDENPLYVPDSGAPEAQIHNELTSTLPVSGVQWSALQPLSHSLSYLAGLKPFSELRGYQRSGLGLPIRIEP